MLEQRIEQQFIDSADLKYQAAQVLSKPIAAAIQALLVSVALPLALHLAHRPWNPPSEQTLRALSKLSGALSTLSAPAGPGWTDAGGS